MANQSIETNLQGRVGPSGPWLAGTQSDQVRFGLTGELITGAAHGQHAEAMLRGRVFSACNQAAIAPTTTLTATALHFTLYNPAGSNTNLVILQSTLSIVTCTTAGSIVYAANVNPTAAAPATNTELVVRNNLLGFGSGVAKVYSVTTLPAAPVAVRTQSFCVITTVPTHQHIDYLDGVLGVAPGCCLSIQGITFAGTVLSSMTWEEVPIPS